jgi:hypothetical protein
MDYNNFIDITKIELIDENLINDAQVVTNLFLTVPKVYYEKSKFSSCSNILIFRTKNVFYTLCSIEMMKHLTRRIILII